MSRGNLNRLFVLDLFLPPSLMMTSLIGSADVVATASLLIGVRSACKIWYYSGGSQPHCLPGSSATLAV